MAALPRPVSSGPAFDGSRGHRGRRRLPRQVRWWPRCALPAIQSLGWADAPRRGSTRSASLAGLASLLEPSDVVIGAAGLGIKDASSNVELIRGNLAIARSVADAALARGARLLLVSSADLWPLAARAGASEQDEVLPDTAYGFSKLVAESALQERSGRGLRFAIARPSYVFGPGMFMNRLFPAVLRQAQTGRVVLKGDAESVTDFFYVEDFTMLIAAMLKRSPFEGEVVHAASGKLTRLVDAARAMIDALGSNAELVIDGAPGPRQAGAISIERARTFGFTPRFDVAAGCRRWVAQMGASP